MTTPEAAFERAPLLRCHLEVAVPLLIDRFLAGRRLRWPRPELARFLAANGDAILHRIPGRTEPAVSALVEALATLAFSPGGVRWLGLHFEVPPAQARPLLEQAQGLARRPPAARTEAGPVPGGVPTFEALFRPQLERLSGGTDDGPDHDHR